MPLTASPTARPDWWLSLWVVALISLILQLWLCQFFSFGELVPYTIDINPSNLWKMAYHFPPTGVFRVLNWFGQAYLPQPLNPLSVAAHSGAWFFFTAYAPAMATCALLAMAAFLREFGCPRPAALFGAVTYAWQGDILSFVFPGHFAYIATWPFYAIAAWAALRGQRLRAWPYALLSGVSCGLMVQLQPDRGAIASLLIAALYLAPAAVRLYRWKADSSRWLEIKQLVLCVAVAGAVSLSAFLSLFQGNIVGSTLGGHVDSSAAQRDQTFKLVTQFSLGPEETLTYLVPGVFGWHSNSPNGPYWGEIGRWPGWAEKHEGTRNLNLAISTTGTVATLLGLIGVILLLPGGLLGPAELTDRQRFFGRLLLVLGLVALVLSWGYHTSLYRPLLALPLMDKWRNPLKWLEITNFALITLGALGMQHVAASMVSPSEGLAIVRRRLTWLGGIAVGALALALVLSYPYTLYVLPAQMATEGYQPDDVAAAMNNLHVSLRFALGIAGLACAVVGAFWRPAWLGRWTPPNPLLHRFWLGMLRPESLGLSVACILGVFSALQLGWVTSQFILGEPLSSMTASNPLLDELRAEPPDVRCSVAVEDPILNVLLLNQFSYFGISSLDISAASRTPDDLNTFFGVLGNNRQRLCFLGGVKNIAVPEPYVEQMRADPLLAGEIDRAEGFTLIPTDQPNKPTHALVKLKDYLAKATFVPAVETLAPGALLMRLKDPAWNPRGSILLEGNTPPPPPASPRPEASRDLALLTEYTPSDIQIDVESIHGGYILVNDQYDTDWQATLNGSPAPILRADWIMRAVAVPPGLSSLTMHYSTRYHVGNIIQGETHLPVGDLTVSATTANLFSDAAMLVAWGVGGFLIWRGRRFPVV